MGERLSGRPGGDHIGYIVRIGDVDRCSCQSSDNPKGNYYVNYVNLELPKTTPLLDRPLRKVDVFCSASLSHGIQVCWAHVWGRYLGPPCATLCPPCLAQFSTSAGGARGWGLRG